METINQRLAFLRKHLSMNPTDFAQHIGIDRSRYVRIEKGPNKPALDAIEAVAVRMPDLSLDWLINGTGPVYRDGRELKEDDLRYIGMIHEGKKGYTVYESLPASVSPTGELRPLAKHPSDPAPPQPTALAESTEMKELKQDRDKWRQIALDLMEELRSRPARQVAATGTDGSFNPGNPDAAEGPVAMSISYREADKAA